jgi:hypothetical protein
VPTSDEQRADQMAGLRWCGFSLEYASMTWMAAEAAAAITADVIALSIALAGSGLDMVIEFFAAAIVAWQLRSGDEDRETRAVRLAGVTFFALAVYLAIESIRDLAAQSRPQQSIPGLAVTAAALPGAGLNAWFRWWLAEPAARLAIAALAVKESMEAREDHG